MIVQNIACPACQEMGHDARCSNLIVFSDGGRFCNRAHHHKNGLTYYVPSDGADPVLDMEINGTLKYSVEQFNELIEEGKINSSQTRAIALSGMRYEDKIAVATETELEALHAEIALDEKYFSALKVRNLVDRHVPGEIAKFYDVRVGLGVDGKTTSRHYYPVFDATTGKWKGAKCRTLPKDFRYGHLGQLGGDNLMFGQKQLPEVIASGSRMDTLLLVGGECDAMAAQAMLVESRKGTKWEHSKFHVWSVMKGEKALSEILLHKESINKFKKILVCFDNDATGNKLNKDVAKLFRAKTYKVQLPAGCNDPNDCLKQGRGKEFVDAWWNPVDPFEGGSLSSMNKYREKAKVMPVMGLSWPFPGMNPVTYGIREHYLSVWGAGTGVGKTMTTKQIVFHIAYTHKEPVVVIYLEERAEKTVRSFAGNLINKDLTAPPCNDKKDPDYTELRDYSLEDADAAIDQLCDDGNIIIGDLEGRKDVDSVMEVIEEALVMGYKYFIIDNLTAFKHTGRDGKDANEVSAVDETMQRLGTFKDENPVWIMLLSHLKKPYGERTPYEEGGAVKISDFRGSANITFWANDIWSIERNTIADDINEKLTTTYHNLKNRDVGFKNGSKVYAKMHKSGKLRETGAPAPKKQFDDGSKPKTKEHDKEF